MKLKVTLAVLAVLGVAGIFAGIKYMQIQAGMAMFANYSPPPEAVTSLKVQEESWKPYLKGVGSTEAVQGVMVSTDLPGIVKTIAFESGQKVKKGDLLVQLDTTQEEAQLRASEARMHLAELNIRRIKNLLDKRVSSQSDYDQAAAEYLQQQANSEEVKATIGRKTMSLYGKDVQKTRIN